MLGSDTNQKSFAGTFTPDMYLKNYKLSLLIFIGPLKFLSILHQTHSNSPFYWNMNGVAFQMTLNAIKVTLDTFQK
jgi:hypothetical protein